MEQNDLELVREHEDIEEVAHRTIQYQFDTFGHPEVVTMEGGKIQTHPTLESVIRTVPSLSEESELPQLAKAANFLFKGNEYSLIEDPDKYKKNYTKDIESEQELFELPLNALSRKGIFDVSEIQSPRIEEDSFIFYVSKRIPYRVTISVPFDEQSQVKYELLNYQ